MRILVVGPLDAPLACAVRFAREAGCAVEHAANAHAAIARVREDGKLACILCDMGADPEALIGGLAHEHIAIAVIACGVDTGPIEAARVIRAGAIEFLPLPPDAQVIAGILQSLVRDADAPIVQDPVMKAVMARAEQVARADASILISGESGTGKEVVARYIHLHSRRAKNVFLALNCAAIPEHLLESEMFGHERGAFSGALARRIGRFEAAEGGTLLLDEISEMDVRLQAKLLRAIQEREIDRLGGQHAVRINVRILATTNRDLKSEIAAGRFREDLYFRLNVVSLVLPPLRERRGDIAPLARHYARHYAELNGMVARPISDRAMTLLCAHRWRGNVRELENTIHRAVLLAAGGVIDESVLELGGEGEFVESGVSSHGLVGKRMADVERDLILDTLSHTLGNRTHAAVMLGISLRALRNKLRDYSDSGIRVPPPQSGVAA